jgi:transposase
VLRKLGEDVTELLEYVPSSFKVIQLVRPKLSCRACETIMQAPLPPLPLERGRPGPALLAHVAVSKYADGLPLYRQSEIYAREGIDLDRSTLADWVGRMAALLDPLVQAIQRHVCAGSVLHADDTTVQVLAPGQGRTRTGRLWTVVRDERAFAGAAAPAAFYRYSPDRRAEHAQALLVSCRGFLHANGYAGFNSLFADDPKSGQPRLTEVACWAHARRAIYEIYESNGSPLAKEALERMAELFEIETRINGCTPQERLAVRQREAVPLLRTLESYLNNALSQISGKSALAKAIRYALSRWTALTRYTTDGRLEMTNNAVERAIQELSVCRFRFRRRSRCRHVRPHRDRQDERPQSRGLFAGRARAHRRSPDQSHRRAAALELAAERLTIIEPRAAPRTPPCQMPSPRRVSGALVNLPINEQTSHGSRQIGRRNSPDAYASFWHSLSPTARPA